MPDQTRDVDITPLSPHVIERLNEWGYYPERYAPHGFLPGPVIDEENGSRVQVLGMDGNVPIVEFWPSPRHHASGTLCTKPAFRLMGEGDVPLPSFAWLLSQRLDPVRAIVWGLIFGACLFVVSAIAVLVWIAVSRALT